jgi:NADPH:quinone reductase-like Zn-dependent oxidoreductase
MMDLECVALQAASDALKPPFAAGNDGLAVVVKVGPGVKNLSENDWVMPFKPGMGTWRSLAVWREKDLLKMPADLLPVEYAAMLRALPSSRTRARAHAHAALTGHRTQARCAWRTGCWRTTAA